MQIYKEWKKRKLNTAKNRAAALGEASKRFRKIGLEIARHQKEISGLTGGGHERSKFSKIVIQVQQAYSAKNLAETDKELGGSIVRLHSGGIQKRRSEKLMPPVVIIDPPSSSSSGTISLFSTGKDEQKRGTTENNTFTTTGIYFSKCFLFIETFI